MSYILDIQKRFPNFPKSPIFDVGANVGQSFSEFKAHGVSKDVWCFEPSPKTFKELQKNIGQEAKCFQLALSHSSSQAWITDLKHSVNNHLVFSEGRGLEKVDVVRGDDFCQHNSVNNISLLKVDTEGNDLNVVHGFEKMIAKGTIDFVLLEVSTNKTNKKHVDFIEAFRAMENWGFYLFGIYEQVFEAKRPFLRRSNMLFIANHLIN